jgi:hypothetical protein
MTAKNLSRRFAGFAFVLAAIFGGVGVASATTTVTAEPISSTATVTTLEGDIIWA